MRSEGFTLPRHPYVDRAGNSAATQHPFAGECLFETHAAPKGDSGGAFKHSAYACASGIRTRDIRGVVRSRQGACGFGVVDTCCVVVRAPEALYETFLWRGFYEDAGGCQHRD